MTNQAGKVGRGIRTIGANIVNMAKSAKELEISVDGVKKTVDLYNETTGDMYSTYDVLAQIADNWDKMSASEQSALAIQIAG